MKIKPYLSLLGLVGFGLFALGHVAPAARAEGDKASGDQAAAAVAGPVVAKATPAPTVTPAPVAPTARLTRDELIDLAKRDPIALARRGRAMYDETIRDYRCVFTKQERIDGRLRPTEEIEVLFRGKPHSVFMKWLKNEDQARRCLFVDTPDRVDSSGQKVAKVEPAGVLIRLVVSEIDMPIHGDRAKAASRRTIDEFGFRSTLDLLDRYNTIGCEKGVLEYRFVGEGTIDSRPTLMFERHLPYDGPKSVYPDAKMIIHLDQEWLLPTAVYSYADKDGKQLLGSYVYTQVNLNPGLTDEHFKF